MSSSFLCGHATHPDWRVAAEMALAPLRAALAQPQSVPPTLGLIYITDYFAAAAPALLEHVSAALPQVQDWAGTVGVGIAVSNAEYIDEPALALLLCPLPRDQFRVFSGIAPLGSFAAHTALVHADASTSDVAELLYELAARTATGYLFGGLASSRGPTLQFARSSQATVLPARTEGGGVFSGGLSGVAFGSGVRLVSRVTQGCAPLAAAYRVTQAQGQVVTRLDGEPALAKLLQALQLSEADPRAVLDRVRGTLVGLRLPEDMAGSELAQRRGSFGGDVLVRHLLGIDLINRGIAIAAQVEPGTELSFCQRNVTAARADLLRICAEIREELESEIGTDGAATARPAAAIYVSCAGRGGPHFGGPNAEMQIVRRGLGELPLVGFFAGGEIARHHIYGYTGVLTVFVA